MPNNVRIGGLLLSMVAIFRLMDALAYANVPIFRLYQIESNFVFAIVMILTIVFIPYPLWDLLIRGLRRNMGLSGNRERIEPQLLEMHNLDKNTRIGDGIAADEVEVAETPLSHENVDLETDQDDTTSQDIVPVESRDSRRNSWIEIKRRFNKWIIWGMGVTVVMLTLIVNKAIGFGEDKFDNTEIVITEFKQDLNPNTIASRLYPLFFLYPSKPVESLTNGLIEYGIDFEWSRSIFKKGKIESMEIESKKGAKRFLKKHRSVKAVIWGHFTPGSKRLWITYRPYHLINQNPNGETLVENLPILSQNIDEVLNRWNIFLDIYDNILGYVEPFSKISLDRSIDTLRRVNVTGRQMSEFKNAVLANLHYRRSQIDPNDSASIEHLSKADSLYSLVSESKSRGIARIDISEKESASRVNYSLGIVKVRLNHYRGAIAKFEQAIFRGIDEKQEGDIRHWLGNCYSLLTPIRIENRIKAIAYYSRAYEILILSKLEPAPLLQIDNIEENIRNIYLAYHDQPEWDEYFQTLDPLDRETVKTVTEQLVRLY